MPKGKSFPSPLSNYLNLIKRKGTPHHKFLSDLIEKMEEYYKLQGEPQNLHCRLIPTVLEQQIGKGISDKLTPKAITWIIVVAFRESGLREEKDYWKGISGRRVCYHLMLNKKVLSKLKKFSKIKSGGLNEPFLIDNFYKSNIILVTKCSLKGEYNGKN